MEARDIRKQLAEALEDLPEDATVEDAMERLYFLAKVQEGRRQAQAGEILDHEEARRRLLGG